MQSEADVAGPHIDYYNRLYQQVSTTAKDLSQIALGASNSNMRVGKASTCFS